MKQKKKEERMNQARILQEQQKEVAKLHHLELQVELQDYV